MSDKYRTRLWLLMLLAAAGRTGFARLEKSRLHRILFLSNCLAPIYHRTGPSHLVMRYVRGPFYPDAQWDIDRMVAQGLISVTDVQIVKDKHGPWMHANYGITRTGFDLIRDARSLTTVTPIWEFMLDLTAAYASVKNERRDSSVLKDVTYDQPGIPDKGVINFADHFRNLSTRTANTFVDLAPEMLKPGRQDRLVLYLKYLELRAA